MRQIVLHLAIVAAGATTQVPFQLSFDPNTALVTSLSNTAFDLSDTLYSPIQLPVFFYSADGPQQQTGINATLVSPCISSGPSSYTCTATVTLTGTPDSCGNANAVLSIIYSLSLDTIPNTNWTVLSQNITHYPKTAGCVPTAFYAMLLPRAITLRQPAAASGSDRQLTGTYRASGAQFSLPLATSGDYDGFSFVSAGEAWEPPTKLNPAYPGYTLAVPGMDEYLVAPSSSSSSSSSSSPPSLRLTTTCDVYYFTNFNIGYAPMQSAMSWAYNCSDPNIGCFSDRSQEVRRFWTIIATDGDASLDAFMGKLEATSLAAYPPAPAWTMDIAITNYDYFTPPLPLPGSQVGWDSDVDAMAAAIPLENRSNVLFCMHGWYGTLGWYTLASPTGTALVDDWVVFPSGASFTNPVTNVPLGPLSVTKDTIHARIQRAKNAGFRVVVYFADGLNTCTGVPFYDQQSILTTYHGYEWVGPDSNGTMKIMNPLAAVTKQQFHNYMQGLLDEYGAEIDGFVWDETFEMAHNTPGVAGVGTSGYASRAMMELIESLTQQVHTHPNCAGRCGFFVAPCTYEMPDALVCDGTYEDTGLNPAAASLGILPNWRGALFECGWRSISKGYYDRNNTEEVYAQYNVPAGIGNGWGDFIGFSNFTEDQKSYFVDFIDRHDPTQRARYPSSSSTSSTSSD